MRDDLSAYLNNVKAALDEPQTTRHLWMRADGRAEFLDQALLRVILTVLEEAADPRTNPRELQQFLPQIVESALEDRSV